MLENITASEVAGYGVGAFLLYATLSATKIDSFISTSQRSSLGMCKRCGDLKLIACSKCKGQGIIRENMFFNFNAMDDLSQSYGGNSRKGSLSCKNCRAKGHFSCPECSNVSQS
ncbi:uncharacterized protein LOC141670585 [Apium graveolens]|uniref:Heat shock protein DnaJ, cysteine-rich domain containing protein n=1 Tax=Heracleum sosnowskyi TaxID=360622 RepID=A0AAD8ME68_9APIA|nr:Heat shock protein DnaJ, cysteine-rich domain containing protein [Heracleum sosnowskyi]